MYTPTLRRNAISIIRTARSRSLQPRSSLLQRLATPQWLRPTLHHQRPESTAATRARQQAPYKYPEELTVYAAPFAQTAVQGFYRASAVAIIAIGWCNWAPRLLADPTVSNWIIPAVIVGSTIPFLALSAWGPLVCNITLYLPPSARRSKDALLAFANRVPPNTRVKMKFLRFAPWLTTWEYIYSDLRRLPVGWGRLSNLEHIPYGKVQGYGTGVRGWVAKTYFGRYFVNMTETRRDRSAVPGVWEVIWKKIPFASEGKAEGGRGLGKGEAEAERKPAVMRNRAMVSEAKPVARSSLKGARR